MQGNEIDKECSAEDPAGSLSAANRPRLSVGLAVYNGELYLRESIDSILAQTYSDFELILSDNASTDATPDICAEYAAKDKRVKYVRNDVNIGGANNENQTFRLARGIYFRWAAHDDICEPTLFEKCISVLERQPGVVLAYTAIREIDEEGNEIRSSFYRAGTAKTPSQRLAELSSRVHLCEATYGILRSSILAQTELQKNYTNSDRVLLCELAMHGPFVQLEDVLFNKRRHEGNEYKDWRGRMSWFLPGLAQTGEVKFPNWMELADYFATVRRVKLDRVERLKSYLRIVQWMLVQSKPLAGDLVYGFCMMLRGKRYRTLYYADTDRWS